MPRENAIENLLVKYHRFWYLDLDPTLVQLKNLTCEQVRGLKEEQQNELLLNWDKFVWNENKEKQKSGPDRLLAVQDVTREITGRLLFPQWIMDRFKEALDQNARGEWISSIALCGVIVEAIVGDFFEVGKYKDRISLKDRKITNNTKANLLVLKAYDILRDEDYERLDDVRRIRNKYVHPEKLRDNKSQRSDNLVALTKLCQFFNETNMKQYEDYIWYASELYAQLVKKLAIQMVKESVRYSKSGSGRRRL